VQWKQTVESCPEHDYYHLHGYHRLAEARGEGDAYLFVYAEGPYTVAIPLLLRPVTAIPGLETAGRQWRDATSVYGYCGPIASHAEIPEGVALGFRDLLSSELAALSVVCAFSRLNPLLLQAPLLAGMGECAVLGQTISIDLSASEDVQLAGYRKGYAYDIRRLRRDGMTCVHDDSFEHFDTFIELYQSTMRRVGASSYYLFDRSYFDALRDALAHRMHLFVTMLGSEVTSAGLFVECGGILQYHLSGTAEAFAKLASTKLLLDSVRAWAKHRGLRVFHLGGGVGGGQDNLFFFKSGFSQRRHEFQAWRWILQPDAYRNLAESRRAWRAANGTYSDAGGYFPAYRA
jgi:hypothetical protein